MLSLNATGTLRPDDRAHRTMVLARNEFCCVLQKFLLKKWLIPRWLNPLC